MNFNKCLLIFTVTDYLDFTFFLDGIDGIGDEV